MQLNIMNELFDPAKRPPMSVEELKRLVLMNFCSCIGCADTLLDYIGKCFRGDAVYDDAAAIELLWDYMHKLSKEDYEHYVNSAHMTVTLLERINQRTGS